MKDCITQLDELIEYCRRQIEEFGWFRYNKSKKYIVIVAMLTAFLEYKVRKMNSKCSLLQIIRDLSQLPQFRKVSEKELILTILLFYFDKELLKRSKELISYSWEEQKLESKIGHGNTSRRTKHCGISLVLFFKYPDKLLRRLNNCVKPIELIHRTASDHFTLMNFTTSIDKKEVDDKCKSIKRRLIKFIQTDKDLSQLITQLKNEAAIKDEFRILQDGALILYGVDKGTGNFLETIHKIRIRLRDLTITESNGKILNRDPLPLWSHTVFGRIGKPLNDSQISQVRDQISLNLHGARWQLEKCRIGLLIFEDRKAVLEPRKEIYL